MLQIEPLLHTETERAAQIFHHDGFVTVKDALTSEQTSWFRGHCESG